MFAANYLDFHISRRRLRRREKLMKIPRFLPLVLALPVLAMAALLVAGQKRQLEEFLPVMGRVTEVSSTSCGNSGQHTCWRPVVEYSLDGRTTRTLRSNDRLSTRPEIGAGIALLVNPRNQDDARINSHDGLWNTSIVVAFLAGLFFLFAAAYGFMPRK